MKRGMVGVGFCFVFMVGLCLVAEVNEKIMPPAERLNRMRAMFAATGGILAEDYEHFTQRGAPTVRSKVPRKSERLLSRPVPRLN